jgi:hypothetical protein
MSGLSSLDGRMGTLPMHSGFILKDYSEKVKRTAASCQAAGARQSRKASASAAQQTPFVKKDCFLTVSAKPLRESGGALPS